MHTSRYNVLDRGQLVIAPGTPIDEAEAIRQGIIRPAPTLEDAAAALPSPTAEAQALAAPTATVERKSARERTPERDHPGGREF